MRDAPQDELIVISSSRFAETSATPYSNVPRGTSEGSDREPARESSALNPARGTAPVEYILTVRRGRLRLMDPGYIQTVYPGWTVEPPTLAELQSGEARCSCGAPLNYVFGSPPKFCAECRAERDRECKRAYMRRTRRTA